MTLAYDDHKHWDITSCKISAKQQWIWEVILHLLNAPKMGITSIDDGFAYFGGACVIESLVWRGFSLYLGSYVITEKEDEEEGRRPSK